MINTIEGIFGRLGKGKTLRCIIKTYEKFCDGREVFSNLPVAFKHNPIKTVEDFLNICHGEVLGDELWVIGDNRKRNALSDLATIFCLRSRKQDLNIRYTQQFLQIDIRIAYITNLWVKPCCYPISPEPEIQYEPEYMICRRWNEELEEIPSEIYEDVKQYFPLYDTNKDPYFVKSLLDEKLIQRVKKQLKERMTDEELKLYNRVVGNRGNKKLVEPI